jgi:IS30 family transposase
MSYQHLTLTERFTLYEWRFVLKESLSTIAAKMGRAKSTLSRGYRSGRVRRHAVVGFQFERQ